MVETEGITTRQERRAAARKAQILTAASIVFAQKGYPRATTAEIAALADVSEGTIYNYFESKHDLLVGIMAELAAAAPAEPHTPPGADPVALFHQLLQERSRFEEANGAMLKVVTSEVLVDAHLAGHYYETLLGPQLTQMEGLFHTYLDHDSPDAVAPALAARIVSALFTGLFIQAVIGDRLASDQQTIAAVILARLLHDPARQTQQGS